MIWFVNIVKDVTLKTTFENSLLIIWCVPASFLFSTNQWVWKITRECLDLVFLSTENKTKQAKQKPFAPWRRVFSCHKQFACFTVSFYVCVGFLISLLFSLVEKLQSCKMQTSERMIKILLTPYLAILPTSLGSNNK